MLGVENNKGIIWRSVEKLFEAKEAIEALSRGNTKVCIKVEMLEIYNEEVRDLLCLKNGKKAPNSKLEVKSSEAVGNILLEVSSDEEVFDALALAQERRCVKATMSNAESSRSHLLFTIHFEVTSEGGGSRTGKLHVCDLAGSERLKNSGVVAVSS